MQASPIPMNHVEFRGELEFLSNFTAADHELTLNISNDSWQHMCISSHSVEHLFQAAKATRREDIDRILDTATPGQAKRIGGSIVKRDDWEAVRFDIMVSLLEQKFAPGTRLAGLLLATGTRELIEWNIWHDTTWGRCTCIGHSGDGDNLLGRALMLVRSRLQALIDQPSIIADESAQ
jgi:ribA/ribD-fused uncharacterized protein